MTDPIVEQIADAWPGTTDTQLGWIGERIAGIRKVYGHDAGEVLDGIVRQIASRARYKSITLVDWENAAGAVLPSVKILTAEVFDDREEREEAEYQTEVERVRSELAKHGGAVIRQALMDIISHYGDSVVTDPAGLVLASEVVDVDGEPIRDKRTVEACSIAPVVISAKAAEGKPFGEWSHMLRCNVLTWIEGGGARCLEVT